MVKKAFLLLVFLSLGRLLQAENFFDVNSSLTPSSQPLNSSSSAFMLSFRSSSSSSSTGNSTNLYLAISFAASPDGPPAWVANRNQPVSASATLTLSSSGELLLFDPSVSSTSVWSSGTSKGDVVRAQLLDNGNLVLLNRSSGYVWQSFQNPTDTLLPGQNFTADSRLTSAVSPDDYSYGRYSLAFAKTGVLQLSYVADSQTYWTQGTGNIAIFQFDQSGNIFLYNSPSSINSTFISNDHGSSATRRLTLDVDGNLRMYSWEQASAQWNSVWLAFTTVCSTVKGLCGDYGVCIYEPQPTCICPPGFSVANSTDLSRACNRNHNINSCNSTKYVEMEDTDFPDNDYQSFLSSSVEDCKNNCTKNCSCLAAVYWQTGDGHCWLKSRLQNGISPGSQQHRVFLKISDSDPFVSSPVVDIPTKWSSETLWQPPSSNQSENPTGISPSADLIRISKEGLVIALAVVISAQFLCFVATFAVLTGGYRRKLRYVRLHGDLEGVSGSPLVYSYQELEAATENFTQNLGAGSFGTVFKGRLRNGKVVAVKQLKGVSQQERHFRAEIATIGRIHHINLVRLLGFCAEGNHRLLVYEYMENGSLDQILFNQGDNSSQVNELDWGTRFQICLGVARGISYLHEECLDCILHCDIKPQNILLDRSYGAKVADFGLAYLYDRDHTVKMTTIRGTRGYMAPEWVSNLPITAKADVYSYGMLIMEIVSGRANNLYTESAMMETGEKWCFPMWAYGKRAEEVADARMQREAVDWNQVDGVMKVAYACIQTDMQVRPPMAKVVQMLEGTLPIPEAPLPSLFREQ